MEAVEQRAPGIRVIAAVNAFAAVLTLAFWTLGYLKVFAGKTISDPAERASAAATLGFLVGDLAWAFPLLALSVPGLWRRRAWGWTLAQMVNVLWAYSMTVIWVRDLYSGAVSPGALLFTPFVPFAAWAAVYLWRVRGRFGMET
jgi:hypothetical protein